MDDQTVSSDVNLVLKSCPLFWNNYHRSCLWLQNQGFTPVKLPFSWPQQHQYSTQNHHQTNHQDKLFSQVSSLQPVVEQSFSSQQDDDEHEVNDNQVDEDYIRFILETKRHQREREKLRAEKVRMEKNEEIVYKDIREVDLARLTKLSVAGSKQAEEDETHSHLYGSQSSMIKAKESLLQNDFNIFCDKKKPQFWPTIPIQIK